MDHQLPEAIRLASAAQDTLLTLRTAVKREEPFSQVVRLARELVSAYDAIVRLTKENPMYKSLKDARDKFLTECEAALSEAQSIVEEMEGQEDLLESQQEKIEELKNEIELLEAAIEAAEQLE